MKSYCPFAPAWAGILVAFGMAAAPAPAAAQLAGHVKSVDTDANKLIVTETGTGNDYAITVNGRTRVVTSAGATITMKDLRKGDGLAVTHVGGVASKIVAAQAPLAGVVKSVDAEAKTVVVREAVAKGEAGTTKDVTVTVNEKTTIVTTEGKALKLGDLKEGDGLAVTRSGNLAQRIDVNVKPDELTGFVKSVGADLKTFVVTETGTTKDVTVAVNEKTTIVTTEGKALKIKDLKEGDGVGIAHTASVAKKVVVNVKAPR